MNESNKGPVSAILWVLAAAYAVVLVANIVFGLGIPIAIVVLISVAFALLHGAVRYGWSGIFAFVVISLVVSNILENTSILTGFPFGHYHYTDGLGPKLFLVPLLIGPSYFASGYFAWMIGNVLIGEIRHGSTAFLTVAVPFISAFVMVMWDVTIQHQWIWEQGGGYFGVPLTNYLGWFFTVYVFLQLFALFVRFRTDTETVKNFPRSHFAQPVLMYALMGLTPVLNFVVGGSNTQVTDAAGVVWETRSIAESLATVSIYTMLFVVALSAMKLIQKPATAPETSVQQGTPVTREVSTEAR